MEAAASVIAVIQLTGVIAQICGTYTSKVKDAREDIVHLQQTIRSLTVTLEALDNILHEPNVTGPNISQRTGSEIASCFSSLESLKNKIDPETTQKPMRRWGVRAWKWPLKAAEVDKAVNDIERYKSLFSLGLQIDQT